MIALCRLDELAATGARGVTLADGREIVVVQTAHGAKAYRNSCPHQGIPLETFPDRFLTEARDLLICTGHGALFRVEDGVCVAGPCNGARLVEIPVTVADSVVAMAP